MPMRRLHVIECNGCGTPTEVIAENWVQLLDREVIECADCRWNRKYGWQIWPAAKEVSDDAIGTD